MAVGFILVAIESTVYGVYADWFVGDSSLQRGVNTFYSYALPVRKRRRRRRIEEEEEEEGGGGWGRRRRRRRSATTKQGDRHGIACEQQSSQKWLPINSSSSSSNSGPQDK